MKLFVDSNNFIPDFRLGSSYWEVLLSESTRQGIEIFVPAVVLEEVIAGFRRAAAEAQNDLTTAERRVASLLGGEIQSGQEIDIHSVTEEYSEFLREKLESNGASIPPYPAPSHQEVVQRIHAGSKPFGRSAKNREKGYRDFLIWCTIMESMSGHSERVLFATRDKKDYSDSNGGLHPELSSLLEERGLADREVVLYNGIRDFVDREIEPTLEVINAQELETAVVSLVFEELPDAMGPLEPEWVGLSESASGVRIEEVTLASHPYSIEKAVMLENGRIWIHAMADVKAELSWWEDVGPAEPGNPQDIRELVFGRRYNLAGGNRDLMVTVSLIYDPDSQTADQLSPVDVSLGSGGPLRIAGVALGSSD